MLTFDASALAQVAAPVRGAQWLVELEFASGTVRYTTNAVDILSGGHTWQGFGALVSVGGVRETEDGSSGSVTLGLSIVSAGMIAAASGNIDNYRAKPARLYLQLIGETYQAVGAPTARWSGYMDKVRINRKPSQDGTGTGSIEMVCSRANANRSRTATGLRHTHAQHIRRFPGDNGFEYIATLIETPAVWLSKKFQER